MNSQRNLTHLNFAVLNGDLVVRDLLPPVTCRDPRYGGRVQGSPDLVHAVFHPQAWCDSSCPSPTSCAPREEEWFLVVARALPNARAAVGL